MAATLVNSSAFLGKVEKISQKSFNGKSVSMPAMQKVAQKVATSCSMEEGAITRRAAVAAFVGSVVLAAQPSFAAYGEKANVFGKAPTQTGMIPFQGEGFSTLVPAKWGPTKEFGEFPGTLLRYEDNFWRVNNLSVIKNPSSKASITDYGTPADFLNSISFILGETSEQFKSDAEGGFAPNTMASANLLESGTRTANGKTYYTYEIITRTADGNEGGKHVLIQATVSNGNLWIQKVQAGDKRWFKGVEKDCRAAFASFVVA
uniref:23 kDa subunit of oxygen evolving system of photosystem II n=1 Tax=Mesostigma viride TaxID=41882 RepID=A0A7S4X4K2_MESVI|eukprot:jgi/Mesvir1/16437/Mv18158-RA.1